MRSPGSSPPPLASFVVAGLLLLGGGLISHWQEQRNGPVGSALPTPEPAPGPSLRPLPEETQLDGSTQAALLAQLQEADRQWLPRVERLPDGRNRYVYKRRAGEPALSLEQVKALLRNPPRFERQQGAIRQMLGSLERSGVVVLLEQPRKPGAAGEWNPRRAELRIRPDVPGKGSAEFARVLNHETIHVAQSCRGGGLRAQPKPLGLSRQLDARARQHLAEPLYAKASARERVLEEEAYAGQDLLNLGTQLLAAHCRLG
ncbi:hypothetical protein [Vulcanococcus sp.]|jgi:hypothetical protein|uniref:hypothetical protein n=1 Tax=Vulcanococcus sp. TaxID=2856995 RepID=UPI0037DA2A6A